ncbi:patched domain-containing protein 3-like isoform X1 [Centruroides sculpturatus]|uniref:patched domain-containing protein 3-like isoform X1 n=1 Tax=Centruroides sculpturatus TaxID=218467 RepID=UPI000C6EA82D|nr:patched domain-containing protein 3-like isoform X1 [Centruroides sculpturatus]
MPIKAGLAYKFLSKKFENHGRIVNRNAPWFLAFPIFITLLLTTGIQRLKINFSDDTLISEIGIIGKYKSLLTELFPTDYSEFYPEKSVEPLYYGTVIVEPKDKGSVLRSSVFQEITKLDKIIREFTITDEGRWKYEDLCAKNKKRCWRNKILLLQKHMAQIENGTFPLKYPRNDSDDIKEEEYNLVSLGGVTVNNKSEIISARALRLVYILNSRDKTRKRLSRKWQKNFIDNIDKLNFSDINVVKDHSFSHEESKTDLLLLFRKYVFYSMLLMVLFVIGTCLSPDFLRSKPWIGILSTVVTGMSVISGIGLLMYLGFAVTVTTIIVPFLVLGIGMDDTFIMLSAWMKAEKTKSVEDKMAEMFSETGVSITITSLTNITSFVVGIIFNSVPEFREFCLFMATCLTFDYIYQITFIGACFVYCGKAEEKNLHSLLFLPLKKFSSTVAGRKSLLKNIFCYVQAESTDKNTRCWLISNTWENFIQSLTTNVAKLFVIILYLLYLGFAIWGITKLSFEADLNLNVIGDTYRDRYYRLQKQYYYQYQHRLQFIILEKLDYADPLVQQKVEKTMQTLESDPLIGGSLMTESWLRSYLRFVSDKRISLLFSSYNLTNTEDFIFVLRNFFLRIPEAKRFKNDISFDSNNRDIVASRFFLQTNVTRDGKHFYSQLVKMRRKLDETPLNGIIYNWNFFYFDLVDIIPVTASQTFSVVLAAIFVVCVILLPSYVSILCVLLDIVSAGIGVLGYMSYCNINLNLNSITMFIIVIGFSVDNAAHVSCAYVSSSDTDPNRRLVRAVSLTGIPVIQGCTTTVLALVMNVFLPSPESHDAVIIISISCAIAILHGVLFIPVIMTLLSSIGRNSCKRQNREDENVNDIFPKQKSAPCGVVNLAMKEIDDN